MPGSMSLENTGRWTKFISNVQHPNGNAIKSVIKDAFSKLIIDSEFFTLVIRIKFTMKKDMVNEGNKILTGNFHKKEKEK